MATVIHFLSSGLPLDGGNDVGGGGCPMSRANFEIWRYCMSLSLIFSCRMSLL